MNAYRIVTRIQDQDDFGGVPASGQVLVFDEQTGKFITVDPNLISGVTVLASLSDVQVTNPSGSDVLIYSSANQKWVNEHILDGGNW